MSVRQALTLLGNLIFPPKCASCGGLIEFRIARRSPSALCIACRRQLEKEKARECPRCKRAMSKCRCMPPPLDRAQCLSLLKLVAYEPHTGNEAVNKYLFTVKRYACKLDIIFSAEQLRARLIEEMRENYLLPDDCLITYMPRSEKNISVYGYDQGKALATELSKITGIELVECFARKPANSDQKRLGEFERRMNMNSSYLPLDVKDKVSNKTVVIVDDIVTSGSTMASCVRMLSALDAYASVGLCLAKTVTGKKSAKNAAKNAKSD